MHFVQRIVRSGHLPALSRTVKQLEDELRIEPFSANLERRDEPAIPERTLYALHRPAVAVHRRTDAPLEAIRQTMGVAM